jgi:Flp pilus assembly protein protease CpaA
MAQALTRNRVLLARAVALTADAIQIGLFPLFAGGAVEGADLALEAVTGLLLCWICGFHVAFLPTVIGEALPLVDLFPSWTLATLFVTRNSQVAPRSLPTSGHAKR